MPFDFTLTDNSGVVWRVPENEIQTTGRMEESEICCQR